ncbi:Nop15p [Sugiyamaella lignohabitans]|uniref:Nop15p n=1 Tax=Sugiyamaella lignohabitans TaxID=796027 RepID=A0A167DVZ7_9ASCO|nr:Nop15p [Sugiyamaella lignohabitans]ANB13356.1 Nop15p [Sugiyamaella lignohabitans]
MVAKTRKATTTEAKSHSKSPIKAQVKSAKVSKSPKVTKKTETADLETEEKQSEKQEPEDEEEEFDGFASSDDEIDGFESTDDEDEETTKSLKSSRPQKTSNDISEKEIKNKIDTALSEKKQKATKESKEKPGVLYIGRIPHGFYEEQMKSYFSQFGDITRLRLSRNKKTGKPKHFAFIEFESSEVARIVSETMDNYLLFGHILKVKLIPQENVHDELFNGANKTFKSIPWTKISKHRNDQKKTKETWEKLQTKEVKRREEKAKKLADLGIDFKYESSPVVQKAATKTKPKAKGKKSKA